MRPECDDDFPTDAEICAQELYACVKEKLADHVQSLVVEVTEEGIHIYGFCHSYHSKQMVQETVSMNTSRRIVSNFIVVREFSP